jgi:hypothetical protein
MVSTMKFSQSSAAILASAKADVAALKSHMVSQAGTQGKAQKVGSKIADIAIFYNQNIEDVESVFKDNADRKKFRFRSCTFTLKVAQALIKAAKERNLEMVYMGCTVKELDCVSSSSKFRAALKANGSTG